MPPWISLHPGRRPWGWWEFESVGRRERTDGGVHPHDSKERSLMVASGDNPNTWKRAYRLHFGMPTGFFLPFDRDLYDDFFKNTLHGQPSQIFEEEWAYLVRHNLLLPEDSP